MIPGIIFILLGLGLFIGAGIKLDDAPGLEKKTLVLMGVALVLLAIGGMFLLNTAFGS